jgi:hypothetical protein
MFLVSFFGMVFGVALFAVYYRHYHSKDVKANVKYTTIFAAVITIASSFVFYQTYAFSQSGIQIAGGSSGIPGSSEPCAPSFLWRSLQLWLM